MTIAWGVVWNCMKPLLMTHFAFSTGSIQVEGVFSDDRGRGSSEIGSEGPYIMSVLPFKYNLDTGQ